MTEEALFELARTTPEAERTALLDRVCQGKPELRAKVEALLKADAASAPMLKQPVPLGPTVGYESSHSSPLFEQAGTVIAGRFTLCEKLGEGGMGEVWVASQTEPVKRKVALKFIRAGMDTKSVLARFEQERQALAVMDHPNIAKVLDGGLTDRQTPFFVMELVAGLPLNKYCDQAKLPIKDRLRLFVSICQAVQHAHQKGIVHRDLKPGNILVTMIDGKPTPKIIDFGVAKAVSGKLTEDTLSTQFGAMIGTMEYMAPEQAGLTTQDVDTRADIYSLGVILFEMLTGLRPFDSNRLKQAAFHELLRILKEEDAPIAVSSGWSSTGMNNPIAKVWDADTGKELAVLKKSVSSGGPLVLGGELNCSPERAWISPDSKTVYLALKYPQEGTDGHDMVLGKWDLHKSGNEISTDRFHEADTIETCPGFSQWMTGSQKGLLQSWARRDSLFWDFPGYHSRNTKALDIPIGTLKYSANGKHLLFLSNKEGSNSSKSGTIQVLDTHALKRIALLSGHDDLADAEFHPDGEHVLTVGGKTLRVWSIGETPGIAREIQAQAPVPTESKSESKQKSSGLFNISVNIKATSSNAKLMSFSPDGNLLLIGNADYTTSLWNIHSGTHVATTASYLGGSLTQASFHPTMNEISFAVDHDSWWPSTRLSDPIFKRSALFLWDWKTGPEKKILKGQFSGVRHFQWSKDRKRLLIVSNGSIIDEKGKQSSRDEFQEPGQGAAGEVSLWDAHTGNRI